MIRYKTRSGKPETFTYKNIKQRKESIVIDGKGTLFQKPIRGLDKFTQKYAGDKFGLIIEIDPKDEPVKEEPKKEVVEASKKDESVKEEPVKEEPKKEVVEASKKDESVKEEPKESKAKEVARKYQKSAKKFLKEDVKEETKED